MREFTCVVCGKKGIDNSFRGNKKYCSEECQKAQIRANNGWGARLGESCKYNDGVNCDIQQCENCGWNPVVEKRRKEELGCKDANE